jgi:type I restriction enzyme S subunit
MKYTTIGKAFKLKSGAGLSAKKMIPGGFPVFGGNGINGNHNEYMFEDNKIAIGRVGAYCGNVHKTEAKAWITDNALYIHEFFEEYNVNYLVFLLRSLNLNKYASQSGQPLISAGRLKDVKIPLPPIDKQKKIAAILDAADGYRQKTKALIEKYDELTQSLFLDMFGDPLVNSKNWATEQFGNVISEMQNGIGKGKEHYGSGTKVANIGDLYTSYDFKPVKYSLLDVSNKEINKYCLKYGDLLFVRSSLKKEGVAVCSFYNSKETCLFSSFMIKASPKLDILNPYFLSIQMRMPSYRIYIVNAANTATITNISQPNLKELNIIIPPMDLQNQFAERVQAIEAQKAQAQASLAQAEDLFNGLLQRAFKGELV